MMSLGPPVWMVVTAMAARPYASTGRGSGPLSVRTSVEPVGFHRTADGAIIAEVRQSVRDLEGKPLQGQTHGLKDKTVGHVFRLREGKVARFDIQDAA